MSDAMVRIKRADLNRGQYNDEVLEELIVLELYRISKYYKFPFVALMSYLKDILGNVKHDISKFNTGLPYPPQGTNLLCIQLVLPDKEVKVGAVGWDTFEVRV